MEEREGSVGEIRAGAVHELFKGRLPEPQQRALREEVRQRLHPISCRICRQELAYLRDVGRFPMEEQEVMGAYREGRGYRVLLTVWWSRVVDHLAGELKEMPAVSSYYRHMSSHLGVRTERDPPVPDEESPLAQSGGFTSAVPTPSFPTVVSVPVPDALQAERPFAEAYPEPRSSATSVMRMARTIAELSQLSAPHATTERSSTGAPRATAPSEPSWIGRSSVTAFSSGGYATPSGTRKRKRDA